MVVRFTNRDVEINIEDVDKKIKNMIKQRIKSLPWGIKG